MWDEELKEATWLDGGLTKREYFAGLAMQGLIAGCYAGNNAGFTVQGNCVAAVEYADALIAELSRRARDEGE
jgi:hypothetical protein